jgi:hypothetical protein
LTVPVPAGLAETFGYRGSARYVGLYWLPCSEQLIWDDNKNSCTARRGVFLTYACHLKVAPMLDPYNLTSEDDYVGPGPHRSEYTFIIDRLQNRASIAGTDAAVTFLEGQYPPRPELTPEESEEQSHRSLELLRARFQNQPEIDPEAIRQALQRAKEDLERIVTELDRWPSDPPSSAPERKSWAKRTSGPPTQAGDGLDR